MSLVDDTFAKFNKNYVNLDPERTKIARSSRDWLFKQLVALPQKFSDFPRLYEDKHVNFGSFSRNTKIRELDDIDLILTFSADHTTYDTIIQGEEYILRSPETASNLRKRCDENGVLNSTKVVNMLISGLRKVDQYENAEMHKVQEAATLQLSSYEWCFDIVPAFYTDTEFYLIPDGKGNWKATDPRKDQRRVEMINIKHGGKVLQIIRTLKFWNRRALMTNIPSYLFENIILGYFESRESITDFIDLNIRDFFEYLSSGIYYDVSDPKGFQGNLNTLTHDQRQSISNKAWDAYKKANEAIGLEMTDHNELAATRKWAEIFGPDFK